MFRTLSAILLFLAVLTPALAERLPLSQQMKPSPLPSVPPAFLMDDDKGGNPKLSDFKGRFVVLNFWATWCGPCVKEMPALDALAGKLNPADIAVVAVNENSNGVEMAKNFYAKRGLRNLKIYVDTSGRALPLLKIPGLPVTLLINREGKEIGRIEGDADWASDESIAFLRKLAAQ